MKQFLTLIVFVIFSFNAHASDYQIDYAESSIIFKGIHAGSEFNGIFEKWDAKITFDQNDLKNSSLEATFYPNSFKTGNKLYDGTLPQGDWFDVKNHSVPTFKSTSIATKIDGFYTVNGNLTIRSITHPITFDFTLSDLESNQVSVNASFPIDRLTYDIGKKSDAKAEWVSREITVILDIKAKKK